LGKSAPNQRNPTFGIKTEGQELKPEFNREGYPQATFKASMPNAEFLFSMTISKKASMKVKNLGVMTVPTPASSKTVESDLEDVIEVMDKMQPLKRGKCEGFLPDYCGLLEDFLQPYCVYAAIDKESLYKVGYVAGPRGKKAQVFSKKCMGGKGMYRKHQHGRIFSCNSCEKLR